VKGRTVDRPTYVVKVMLENAEVSMRIFSRLFYAYTHTTDILQITLSMSERDIVDRILDNIT